MSRKIRRVVVGLALGAVVALLPATASMNQWICCNHYCGGNQWAQCCYLQGCGFGSACMETYFGCWACCGTECNDIRCP